MTSGEFDFVVGGKTNGEGLGGSLEKSLASRGTFTGFEAWGWTYLHRVHVEAFRHGGHQEHGGKKWKPLAASTVKQKRGKGRGKKSSKRVGDIKILVDTGAMRRLQLEVDEKSGQYVLSISSPVDYWRAHQNGSKRLPQRKVFDLTSKDQASLNGFVRDIMRSTIERETPDGRT